ncbi:MAG: dockerin type I repeat-containing protein [Firmicutes bacterium]|nr:dockerin type I repeat-containing protein [Bacillota bacterium]
MRKIFFLILTMIFTALAGTAVFAAEIKIESAQQLETGEVKVVCALTDAQAVQTLTVISYEAETDLSSVSQIDGETLKKIIHIDQFEAELSAQGRAEFVFDPAAWTDSEKTYVVKVGGEGIAKPDTMIIKKSGESLEFIYGDADGDSRVTASDAVLVLQKALTESAQLPLAKKTDNWFKYADVDGDGYITAADATEIMQKTLIESYIFSVFKK